MKRQISILLISVILFGAIASPGEAALCRSVDSHQVCVIKIKRSAKYYWEYRTVVTVDGGKKALEIYNCRDRTVTIKNKYPIRLKPNSIGELICSKFPVS